MSNMAKLEVKNLTISFRTNNGAVRAVRDISFNLNEGETLAIAGESGSGKSVSARAIMGILAGNAMVDNGEIIYDGRDLLKIDEEDFHTLRGHKLAMVFQDPLSALNPIMKIGRQLTEAMILNNKERRASGRRLFNSTLKKLEKAMIEQQGSANAASVQQKCKTLNAFVAFGVKLAGSYKDAQDSAVEANDRIEEIELALIKRDEKQVRELCDRLHETALRCFDEYFIAKTNAEYNAAAAEVKAIGKKFTMDDAEKLKASMAVLKGILTAAIDEVAPDFFSIGYYASNNGEKKPGNSTVAEINAAAKKALDEGFLNDFIKEVEAALKFSEEKTAEEKKKAIAVLEKELPVFQKEKLDERECRAAAARASEAVQKAIDPLAIQKDNQSYVFASSLKANIERYFKGITHNPKEERRFKRDTAKREKLVAKKKFAPSVVPMNLINMDIAHQNLVTAVKELIENYKNALGNVGCNDYTARANELIEYLNERSSEYAYNLSQAMARHRAIELMKEVGIPEPHKRYTQYPFELSGGMRQRIVIAIALSANPDILICDEPTTALDVTIQAQILELINRLKVQRKLSVIFITHDLGVVANMADRIAVMYAGKIVEYGTADDVFYDPRHPYTWALLSSMPDLETKEKLESIPGTPPNMILPPKGDAFAARNHYAMAIDFEEQPPMFRISDTHTAATWLLHPNAPKVELPAIVRERIERMKKYQNTTEEA